MLHLHNHNRPIASRYLNFNEHQIVYECKCGQRKAKRIFRAFSNEFPIQTNVLMTYQDVQKLVSERGTDLTFKLKTWFMAIFRIAPCTRCGSWHTKAGYFSSGYNNLCRQASGDNGRMCQDCLHIEFDEPYDVRLKKKPDWITLHR
jgi:hypothetical protein